MPSNNKVLAFLCHRVGSKLSHVVRTIMEYLAFLFGDDSNIQNLLAYVSSAKEFENALIPYKEVITEKRGGVFGFGEKNYSILCNFDHNLFHLLDRMQKLELYHSAQEYIHQHVDNIKLIIHLFEQAVRLRHEPDTLLFSCHRLKEVGERIIGHFVYLFLCNLDIKQVPAVFKAFHRAINGLEEEVVGMLSSIHRQSASLNPPVDNENSDDNSKIHHESEKKRRAKMPSSHLGQNSRSEPYHRRY